MKMLKLCSTDGEVLVPLENIDYFLCDPGVPDGTVMVALKSGKQFEVSGDLTEIQKKIIRVNPHE